jgi:hypothetical protein
MPLDLCLCGVFVSRRASPACRDITFPLHRTRQGGYGIGFQSASGQNKANLNYSFRLDVKNRTLSLSYYLYLYAGEQFATMNGQHHNACFPSADSLKTENFAAAALSYWSCRIALAVRFTSDAEVDILNHCEGRCNSIHHAVSFEHGV